MSQIRKKFIQFDTSSNGVNSRVIPANYTPSNYTPTQVSSEGSDKTSAHLKGIDNALGSIAIGSSGDITEHSFSMSNNQVTAANITLFAFSNAVVRSFEAIVSVEINATSSLYEVFKIYGIQKGSSWDIGVSDAVGDNSLVQFTITNAGQIQYTSGNVTGFSTGLIKFRAITTSI